MRHKYHFRTLSGKELLVNQYGESHVDSRKSLDNSCLIHDCSLSILRKRHVKINSNKDRFSLLLNPHIHSIQPCCVIWHTQQLPTY